MKRSEIDTTYASSSLRCWHIANPPTPNKLRAPTLDRTFCLWPLFKLVRLRLHWCVEERNLEAAWRNLENIFFFSPEDRKKIFFENHSHSIQYFSIQYTSRPKSAFLSHLIFFLFTFTQNTHTHTMPTKRTPRKGGGVTNRRKSKEKKVKKKKVTPRRREDLDKDVRENIWNDPLPPPLESFPDMFPRNHLFTCLKIWSFKI